MSMDLWIGSATTLAGAFLGGVISYALSRQQIFEARRQRGEEWRLQGEQTRKERRFGCYSDFITRARSYRNAMQFLSRNEASRLGVDRIDDLAAAADAASSLVFLVVESSATYDACRSVMKAIRECQAYVHDRAGIGASEAMEAEDRLAASLRQFQVAARDELGVSGIANSLILGNYAVEGRGSTE